MNTIGNIRLTPEIIVAKDLSFAIPIYQRLFTWDKKQVKRLMEDLYNHYIDCDRRDCPYYIGALSCVRHGNRYDLIDGQQRMTVISLIGIAINSNDKLDSSWCKFLANGERLHFVARSSDSSYFQGRVLGETNCLRPNQLMEEGIMTIKEFLQNRFDGEELSDFSKWIFKNLSFFISVLPQSYEGNKNLLNK